MTMRSGTYLSAISNRLAAPSPRARFLGMVVGEALSELVDKGDKKMVFKVDEMDSSEAKWYKSLVTVSDTLGSLEHLMSRTVKVAKKPPARASQKPEKPQVVQGGSKIIAIEEVDDDDDDDDQGHESDNDGLVPHAKPDSDEEDSDEDPTLITRNKPTAPVYIRDLINYLRDTENYDKQKLALQSAAPLIRRKANFGTEVSSHAEELATLLVGLQDKYDMEDFQDMRLQGMIAILIAQPLTMGKWFSKTFFDGDYSISQRASVLTTLGLGARELGGFGSGDAKATSKGTLPSSSFPSKALPEHLHKIYGDATSEDTAVDRLSTELSNTMIAPMAADLADKLTGPSILKVRTFSSRMAVEKKRKKPIANSLAKVVADGFFFPLTGRFFIHHRAYGSGRSNVVFQPYLLALFVKTLSLLLHASGPSTLSLPQMTSEFWDLLLSLRTQSIGDITVIEAMLFAFLTIFDINEDKRRLVEEHGRQMLETQEWVEGIFGRVGAGGSQEDEKVRMLAAGCLVRIREVVEKYQALLMGDLASFQN
jgi:telomere length regulation protein